jgi:hypothetical protein
MSSDNLATIMMTLFSSLKAFLKPRLTHQMHQGVVVVRMKREGPARSGVTQEEFDLLYHRLQRVALQYPSVAYDGQETRGGEVRLYFFADAAQPLAKALTLALGEVSWCKGAVVGVCSDTGVRLGEYAVP